MHQLHAIQRALAEIEVHLKDPLPLDELARKVGMSLWHFQRTFAAMVGEPAGGYIRRRRLTEAARCLRATRRTILEVALDHQFESHEAFTRAFKAEMAVTPSAWRSGREAITRGRHPVSLTATSLHQRYQHMKLTPEIVTLPARQFIGLQTSFIAALSPDANNLEVIPKLWAGFDSRCKEVPSVEAGVAYGLIDCPESTGGKGSRPDEILYLASVQVTPDTPPPHDMVAWSSPGGTFAKFIHHGRITGISETMGFIYGQWLPNGGYDRAPGPEIERYDARFNPHSDESILEVYIPVRPATSTG